MKQIYKVEEFTTQTWEYVEGRGMSLVSHTELQPSGADKISFRAPGSREGEEEVYELRSDMTFLVPDHVADFYLPQPGWAQGRNPFHVAGPVPSAAEVPQRRRKS